LQVFTNPYTTTNRFCKFPQEIVLRLEKPARVQQIQILAHEFKASGGGVGLGASEAGAGQTSTN